MGSTGLKREHFQKAPVNRTDVGSRIGCVSALSQLPTGSASACEKDQSGLREHCITFTGE